jgi:hypothetical protein
MKKILTVILLAVTLGLSLVSCNYDIIDTQYSYDTAIITLHDGERIEVAIKSWRDYEDGEQLQITATDGTVYLVSSYNCILIDK